MPYRPFWRTVVPEQSQHGALSWVLGWESCRSSGRSPSKLCMLPAHPCKSRTNQRLCPRAHYVPATANGSRNETRQHPFGFQPGQNPLYYMCFMSASASWNKLRTDICLSNQYLLQTSSNIEENPAPHHHDVPEKNDGDGRAVHAKSLMAQTLAWTKEMQQTHPKRHENSAKLVCRLQRSLSLSHPLICTNLFSQRGPLLLQI